MSQWTHGTYSKGNARNDSKVERKCRKGDCRNFNTEMLPNDRLSRFYHWLAVMKRCGLLPNYLDTHVYFQVNTKVILPNFNTYNCVWYGFTLVAKGWCERAFRRNSRLCTTLRALQITLIDWLIDWYQKWNRFWPTVLSVEPMVQCVVCHLLSVCRLSVCRLWRFVLWQNGAS